MAQITVTIEAEDVSWIAVALGNAKNMLASGLGARGQGHESDEAYQAYQRLEIVFRDLAPKLDND